MNEKQEEIVNDFFSKAKGRSQWIHFEEEEVQLEEWFTIEQLFIIAETMKKVEEVNDASD